MRHIFIGLVALGSALIAARGQAEAPAPLALTPWPAEVHAGSGEMALSRHSRLVLDSRTVDATTLGHEADQIALELRHATGLELPIAFGPARKGDIVLNLEAPSLRTSESYRLEVRRDRVFLTASDAAGLYYGGSTLSQLMTQPHKARHLPQVVIEDRPRFGWRGLMIDSCRHYQEPATIKAMINAMAMLKLNVLQWNLADDQAFRLDIPGYPRLTEVAAFRQEAGAAGTDPRSGRPRLYGRVYSPSEIADIVAYAAARHITVVPEIDMPGHATAVITAYPEFGTTGKPPAETLSDWGIYPNILNPDEKTFGFVFAVLDRVMDLFPGAYIHIGGDEALKVQWKASPEIQARIRALGLKDEEALQAWFTLKLAAHIAAHGRRTIGWDEILQGGSLPEGTAVMSWRGMDGAVAAAKLGHDTVLSPAPILYLDNRQSHSGREPPGRGTVISLKSVYSFDPVPAAIPADQARHVLGLQANLWTEHIRTDQRLEIMAFPRAVAVAELGWSPASAHDWDGFVRRLPAQLKRLAKAGMVSDTVPFEPEATQAIQPDGRIAMQLANEMEIGQIHYTTGHAQPKAHSQIYRGPLQLEAGTVITAQTFVGQDPMGGPRTFRADPGASAQRTVFGLESCVHGAELALEDDAPAGPKSSDRAVVLMDILHPCWIWRGAMAGDGPEFVAHIANLPYNFQLADALARVKFETPQTAEGELVIRSDTCTGTELARIPIGPAAASNPGVSVIRGHLTPLAGQHDLCVQFAQPFPDTRQNRPVWGLTEVDLIPTQNSPSHPRP